MIRKLKKKNYIPISSSENIDDICIYCDELQSKSTDGWIKCIICKRWAHKFCGDNDIFVLFFMLLIKLFGNMK